MRALAATPPWLRCSALPAGRDAARLCPGQPWELLPRMASSGTTASRLSWAAPRLARGPPLPAASSSSSSSPARQTKRGHTPASSTRSGRIRVPTEEVSYSVVIQACSQKGDAQGAASWLEEMASTVYGPNVFAFNAVIAGFAQQGSPDEAARWLARMKADGLEPNVVSYTAVINGCARAGDSIAAVRWFETMLQNGIAPNTASFNAIIIGFARLGDVTSAVRWLERIRGSSLSPDEVSYNSAIHGCACARPARADKAERLFQEMRTAGLWPSSSTITSLDRAVGTRRRDALCETLGLDIARIMRRPAAERPRFRLPSATTTGS